MHAIKQTCHFTNEVEKLMSEYIVEDTLPLSTADSPSFRKLIDGVHLTQVSGRKTLTLHLDKVFGRGVPISKFFHFPISDIHCLKRSQY